MDYINICKFVLKFLSYIQVLCMLFHKGKLKFLYDYDMKTSTALQQAWLRLK